MADHSRLSVAEVRSAFMTYFRDFKSLKYVMKALLTSATERREWSAIYAGKFE